MARSQKYSLFAAAFTLVLFFLSFCYIYYYFPSHPLSVNTTPIVFELHAGSSINSAISSLEKEGMLNSRQVLLMRIWMKLLPHQGIQAGEYAFSLNMTPLALLEKMKKGEVIQYPLTFKEGITFDEMLKIIFSHEKITKTIENKTPSEIMQLLGEGALNSEGIFFPDTYYFTAHTSDIALLQRARSLMKARLQIAWDQRAANLQLSTPYEALILASIIEKEAALNHERFIVSGVFQRRLAKKMRLQTDPTVIYGLNSFDKPLTKKDLMTDTPYNTYLHAGLPPTPIAMPGLKAIIAALNPDNGDTLYFVAKKDGSHHFSSTLKEHNEAVAKYQRGQVS